MPIKSRRPGGGRKPQGNIRGKGDVFTTRITAETREGIEREASRTGQSISQTAERLLMLGLETRRRRENNRPLRALSFLIEQLAGSVSGGRWMDATAFEDQHKAAVQSLQNEWRTDPFRYKAFCIALTSLLESLKPVGEIKAPYSAKLIDEAVGSLDNPAFIELMKNTYKSPENLAAYVFANLWTQLQRQTPLSDREREVMRHAEWVGEMMREEFYALQDARRDLSLTSEGEETK
jgi:hypothetical protein